MIFKTGDPQFAPVYVRFRFDVPPTRRFNGMELAAAAVHVILRESSVKGVAALFHVTVCVINGVLEPERVP